MELKKLFFTCENKIKRTARDALSNVFSTQIVNLVIYIREISDMRIF